ncbi:hypothetical protein SLS60_001846 [Paraconiothyrium brasiliense]|uniref:Uncharacterized protein n=1 Tax=Paraconiothyrium brasiliense TaxID=300254 RepID=A0ABR3S0I0_9PLEO
MFNLSRARQSELELAAEEHEDNLPQLRLQWQYLTEMLDVKLAKVPAQVFVDGRKPTIHDIVTCGYTRLDRNFKGITYKHPDVCFPAHIPRLSTIDDLFEQYDDIAADNFKPRKLDGHGQAAKVVWYWQFDQGHSLSRTHPQVMANVLLAIMVRREGNLSYDMPETGPTELFLQTWRNSNWDLIKSGKTKIKLIKIKLAKLRATIQKTRAEAREFLHRHIEEATENPNDDSLCASWFFLEWEWEMDDCDREAKAIVYADTDALIVTFSVAGVHHDASYPRIYRPLVKALAALIRKGLGRPWNHNPEPEPVRVPWLDPEIALRAILSDGLDDLFAGLNLSEEAPATEAPIVEASNTGPPMPFIEEDRQA